MGEHELRTDLPTLYAAADAAAASVSSGQPALPRALLCCLLHQGMRRVAGGEAQLRPVTYEALQAALLRAAAADSHLYGFDPHGPELPKLLHQLASARLVGWGGGTGGGKTCFVSLRADRMLKQLWRQGAATGPAPAQRSAPGLNRGAQAGGRRSSADTLRSLDVPRIPAAFSLLHLTDHSCAIKLDLTPNRSQQGQRSQAQVRLQAAADAALPGQRAKACWLGLH